MLHFKASPFLVRVRPPCPTLAKRNRREIKAWLIAFSCLRLLWRRNYLERIKIVTNQSSLGLRLTHNEICYASLTISTVNQSLTQLERHQD
ncbi:unnamed protein product [Spirodela intermedia]|uniref:Ribosomal protein L20 n=1 Tax=Spirodela intermedia TaxID=51605 RepID=A0ABN7EBR4_SPIIN|nr:unnamed protein product [Spirodela intermedia]